MDNWYRNMFIVSSVSVGLLGAEILSRYESSEYIDLRTHGQYEYILPKPTAQIIISGISTDLGSYDIDSMITRS